MSMSFRKIAVVIFAFIVTLQLVYESFPIFQTELKIERVFLKTFPEGTSKDEIMNYIEKRYTKTSYKSQYSNSITFRRCEIKGVAVVVITCIFDNKNKLINIEVQKDYGP